MTVCFGGAQAKQEKFVLCSLPLASLSSPTGGPLWTHG